MQRRLLIAIFTVSLAATAQVRDTVAQAPAQSSGAGRSFVGGVQGGPAHRGHGGPVIVTGGTGIRDVVRFPRPHDNNLIFRGGTRFSFGNGCWRGICNPGSGYYYPTYAMPVYVESNNGPDFNHQPSAYTVYGADVPPEYMAPGAAAVAAAYRQGQLEQRITSLADEVARLKAEKEAKAAAEARLRQPGQSDRSFADSGLADAGEPIHGPASAATATVVFKNGTRLDIANYAVVGRTLWVFDEQRARKISLDDLDLAATKKVNAESGYEFRIPAK